MRCSAATCSATAAGAVRYAEAQLVLVGSTLILDRDALARRAGVR